MAKELAGDLEKYSPGTSLVIFTDRPADFKEQSNVIVYQHRQQGIQRCSNDRHLLIEKVLSVFPSAIHIDADTRLLGNLPDPMEFSPGITGGHQNLIEHVQKYRPQSLDLLKKVASKLENFLGNSNLDWRITVHRNKKWRKGKRIFPVVGKDISLRRIERNARWGW